MKPIAGNFSLWATLGIAIAMVALIAFLFIHLFVLIALLSLVIAACIWVAEKILGPGTKIRLRVPPELVQKLLRRLLGGGPR